jgi:hypothetical protein
MGYRSEVAYAIRFGSKADMDTFIGVQLVKKDEHITEALKELEIADVDNVEEFIVFFHADDVKWYPDYPAVGAHTRLYHEAVEMFDDACYLFLRCGEQADDIEEEEGGENGYDLYDYISVSRPHIEVDVGDTKKILTEEGELA